MNKLRSCLLLAMVLCSFTTGVTGEEVVDQKQYEYFLELLNDDDWLTGVWYYESDGAMSLYTLFDKRADGYSVKNYHPRYTVTWWTGKVEKQDNKVLTWDYEIIGDKLQLPDKPTNIEIYKDGILFTSTAAAMQEFYKNRSQVTDPVELKYLASEHFETGERFLKNRLETILRHRKAIPHYDLIADSDCLTGWGDIQEIEIIAENKWDSNEYYLFAITLAHPPRSGNCGASEARGYYWARLQNQIDEWKLNDEWSLFFDDCREGQWVEKVEKSTTRCKLIIKGREGINEAVFGCFEFNPTNIAKMPAPCIN